MSNIEKRLKKLEEVVGSESERMDNLFAEIGRYAEIFRNPEENREKYPELFERIAPYEEVIRKLAAGGHEGNEGMEG